MRSSTKRSNIKLTCLLNPTNTSNEKWKGRQTKCAASRRLVTAAQISIQLDTIHQTLQSPLLTQARELFRLGVEHYRKGLLDKALAAFLKAEEKSDVDFYLQFKIGKLYLYGRDEDANVIDLAKAESHFLLAARNANAERETLSINLVFFAVR